MLMIEITIHSSVPSSNHALGVYVKNNIPHYYPNPSLKALIAAVDKQLPSLILPTSFAYTVEIDFYLPILNKSDGKLKKLDTANMLKYSADTVFAHIWDEDGNAVDDSRIVTITASKIHWMDGDKFVMRFIPMTREEVYNV